MSHSLLSGKSPAANSSVLWNDTRCIFIWTIKLLHCMAQKLIIFTCPSESCSHVGFLVVPVHPVAGVLLLGWGNQIHWPSQFRPRDSKLNQHKVWINKLTNVNFYLIDICSNKIKFCFHSLNSVILTLFLKYTFAIKVPDIYFSFTFSQTSKGR